MIWVVAILAAFFLVYARGASVFKKRAQDKEKEIRSELRSYFLLQGEYLKRIGSKAKGQTWNTFSNKQHRARMSIQDSIGNMNHLNSAIKEIVGL